MAIHTKKRDRLTMMSINSSATFSNAAVTTNATITNNSTCSASNSSVVGSSGSKDQEEEYERAVAFLREFHSRRVAATTSTTLHSTSLDAILEADHFDEMLASEFAMALSVGRRSSTSKTLLSSIGSDHLPNNNDAEDVVERKGESLFGRLRRNPSSGLSRMKKTTTSKCLFGLDGDDDGGDDVTSSSTVRLSPVVIRSSQESSAEPETDYYFGYEEISPMSKRRRGLDS
mmetsp:Transcript_1386/g.2137  ORF Transcript_1386/g.2137 Transcript_1386/m.2137 type:complete len:230 (-) Transcript_1386:230-919(-)|eukprot:CAMPEP_0196179580 /NCGR_PEP_ID=MMETSP0911-20130528/21248_1 /TAXON_ID=49265 /ORGANISM="Thalassiosira rotula, Strain GSO102" /LENGTH=229 /DNA_ID=CAMNT_0041448399 /DNA_START=63 /DNA_END=752 /DNA_ORIENTATION=+